MKKNYILVDRKEKTGEIISDSTAVAAKIGFSARTIARWSKKEKRRCISEGIDTGKGLYIERDNYIIIKSPKTIISTRGNPLFNKKKNERGI